MPVVLATQEVEAGRSLKHREFESSLGNILRPHFNNNNNKKGKVTTNFLHYYNEVLKTV